MQTIQFLMFRNEYTGSVLYDLVCMEVTVFLAFSTLAVRRKQYLAEFGLDIQVRL